jgi:hypothetical protein
MALLGDDRGQPQLPVLLFFPISPFMQHFFFRYHGLVPSPVIAVSMFAIALH